MSEKYPATKIVHTPSGPVAACDGHARAIRNLMAFMGAHTNETDAPEGSECSNCINKAKEADKQHD